MKQSWEKYKNMSNRANLGLFGPFSGHQEFFQKIRLCYFLVLTNPQLHAKFQKNLMSQSWENWCERKWTDGLTDGQAQNHRTLAKRGSKKQKLNDSRPKKRRIQHMHRPEISIKSIFASNRCHCFKISPDRSDTLILISLWFAIVY